jgi:hypothetical protein
MTLEKNRFRVEHGMTMEESHPESRCNRDEGSCNLWEIGFFVAALLRMTVVMNVILSTSILSGDEGSRLLEKMGFFVPMKSGLRMTTMQWKRFFPPYNRD